jgi:hypothetical protein
MKVGGRIASELPEGMGTKDLFEKCLGPKRFAIQCDAFALRSCSTKT